MVRKSKYEVNWELSRVKEDEVLKWAIYLHYAPEDGRVYVGKTSEKPIELRFAKGYKGRLGEYLKAHRLEDMIHVVVDTTDNDLEAKRLEEAYTELYNSTDERYGFNSCVGDIPCEKTHEASRDSNKRRWAEGGVYRESSKRSWQEGGASREASKRNWAEGGACRESWREGGALRKYHCKYWYTIRHPNGEETVTDNLNAFCKEHGIHQGHMSARGYAKGYRVISKTNKE